MIVFHHHSIHLIQVDGHQKVDGHNTKALCSICRKTFNLSNMGHWALLSHEQQKPLKKCEEYESTATNECFF